MPVLALHYFPSSHWSRIVTTAIAEKGLVAERHLVDIRQNQSFDPDYLRINRKGVVPTLVNGDDIVTNAMKIVPYLDTLAGPRLWPDEADLTAWIETLETVPVMLLSYSIWTLSKRGEKSADILADKVTRAAEYAERYPEFRDEYLRKKTFFERFRARVYDDSVVAEETARVAAILDDLSGHVADREWIGADYSLADIMASCILYRLVDLEILDAWRDDGGPLARYFERLMARPSFRSVLYEDPLMPAGAIRI